MNVEDLRREESLARQELVAARTRDLMDPPKNEIQAKLRGDGIKRLEKVLAAAREALAEAVDAQQRGLYSSYRLVTPELRAIEMRRW